MDAIFGETETSELFSPLNGLIISTEIEKMLDKGVIAIVPLLPDGPTLEEVEKWNASEPKDYKIRIIDPGSKDASDICPMDRSKKWGEFLDGRKLEFRNAFRPRARCLYFMYCSQVLKMAWNDERKGITKLEKEFRRWYWGTPGKYLPKNMLLAIVEEIGHDYDRLLKGAMDEEMGQEEENDESKHLLLVAGVNKKNGY